ncbi:cytochrome P450 [Mycena galericulata]|nr:cytochrome P450 [Mycena galericulata]
MMRTPGLFRSTTMPFLDAHNKTLYAAFILAATLGWLWIRSHRRRLPLPPGPRKLPLVGNLFDLPSTFQWKAYARWSKEYNSDIIHLNLAGTSIIVLSSSEATDTLFEKRSSMYSDRPTLRMLVDLMGWGWVIALMKYGEEWRTHRRLLNSALNARGSRAYRPQQLARTRALLRRILHNPDDFLDHFRQMTGEIIISAAYGIDVLPSKDPYIDLAREALHAFSTANIPGRYLVDTFPILKHVPRWFPGAGFKRQAEEWRKLSLAMLEVPFAETKRRMDMNKTPPSFTSDKLNDLKGREEIYYQERHVKAAASTLFFGGADTTSSALATFVLAMLANPESQRKAQAEIDSVIHRKRLPTFEDESSLPYVAAVIKEVMRWELVAPFALPRLLKSDDEYRGYRLPAGSIVIGNAWAILHDEVTYPDPHKFKPERFLTVDGELNPDAKDPSAAFGFGRRFCPGRHMAMSSIWIGVVSILTAFNIDKAVDDQGQVIEPSYEYVSGSISSPLPFTCAITPRSPEDIALVEATAHEERQAPE